MGVTKQPVGEDFTMFTSNDGKEADVEVRDFTDDCIHDCNRLKLISYCF